MSIPSATVSFFNTLSSFTSVVIALGSKYLVFLATLSLFYHSIACGNGHQLSCCDRIQYGVNYYCSDHTIDCEVGAVYIVIMYTCVIYIGSAGICRQPPPPGIHS